jgi:hypothetical protein
MLKNDKNKDGNYLNLLNYVMLILFQHLTKTDTRDSNIFIMTSFNR